MTRPAVRFVAGLCLLALCGPVLAAGDLHISRITPAGDDLRAQRQITISFDRAVVPLGRMERNADEVPASVTPDPGCDWRWLDAQVLACNLRADTALRAATRYSVEVRPGLTALDGSVLRQGMSSRFTTELPRMLYAQVVAWRGPQQPELRVRFNQPVTAASVAAKLKLGTSLDVAPDIFDAETPFYTPQGEARTQWRVWPAQALRPDESYELTVAAGLSSAFGTEPGQPGEREFTVHTFPELRLIGLRCTVGDDEQRFAPGQTAEGCVPLAPISLEFSAPVSSSAVREHFSIAPAPPQPKDPDYNPWANSADDHPVSWPHNPDQTYRVYLPYTLNAEASYSLDIGGGLVDRFGRSLQQDARLALRTGARAPALVTDHPVAVLESGLDSEVPAVVTNLDNIIARYTRMTAAPGSARLDSDQQREIPVPSLRNIAFAMPLDVRAMLGTNDSGALRGKLEAHSGGAALNEQPREFFVTVTPWQIHAKIGHADSLVWVTSLADGKPVANADVAIIKGLDSTARASARTDASGIALLPGTAELDPKLEHLWTSGADSLAVRVQRDQQLAVLPLQSAFDVDIWRASRQQFWSSRRERYAHLRSWGTTAQGVYRSGETVQYKIYVRDDSGKALAAAPNGRYKVTVYDAAGASVHEREAVALNRYGALDGSFALAKNAAVGWYRFELKPDYGDFTLDPLQVLVADFVPAPFRVNAELRAKRALAGAEIPLHVDARLQGGGPFASARLRAQARLEVVSFEPRNPLAKLYSFDSADDSGRELQPLLDQTGQLDAQGEWQTTLKTDDGPVMVGRLLLEGSVEDDRGRSIVGRSTIPYFGRDRYIGVRSENWSLQRGKPSSIDVLVVDEQGEPQRGTPYYVKVERKQTQGARVKGAGNAFITRYTTQWQRVATCKGRSTPDGMACAFTPDAAGEFRITAMVRDSQDRLHQTHFDLYAQGSSAVLWEESPDYSLDLRAEKEGWTVGQTARFLVKNPFPDAQALVTVERYGVLHASVQTLKGSTPVVEIPVLPEYVPGAYVSVVVMSPRVEAPLKGGVDLGKPTFRMGYAKLQVDEPYRHIEVKLTPDREAYRPRENVTVKLQAKIAHPAQGPAEVPEFAVAVVDKAVFDLIASGADYYDPLKGFTALDALDLSNYSLLTQLIGRQKFEKKGANPGGDGGADLSLRSVEKFVAYWNPALVADADGHAQISFELPDQLTGWRVLAMAVTPGDRMGLGQTDISVTKPTELRPAMPNQLAQGDRFSAGFTVLNRADHARKIEVEIAVKGGAQGQTRQIVELASFERKTVMLPLTVESADALQFTAKAGDDEDRDGLTHQVAVRPPRYSATAADLSDLTADQPVSQTIDVPRDAQAAQLSIAMTPTLLGALDGAFRYQREYPHDCWEQRLSKATMAAQFLKFKPRLGPAVEWPDAERQIASVLSDAASFQAPNGGMAFFVASDANVSPYLSAFTGLAFGWLTELGHAPPPQVWDALDEYLLGVLRADPAAQGYDARETRAQLRAVALAALAQRGKVDAAELARHGEQLARMGLFGESLFWQTAQRIDGAAAWAERARERVLARANESAGRLSLEDDNDSAWVWLLGSPVRSNCAALSALVAARDQPGIGELPQKLIRHVTAARDSRTHWSNTQENLYCAQALIAYSEVYEKEPVNLSVKATLGEQVLGTVELRPATSPQLDAAVRSGPQRVQVEASGQGRGYVSTRLRYVEPFDAPAVNGGLSIQRSYSVQRGGQWQALKPNANGELEMQQGELLKVDLVLEAPAWMTYVVVDDPVPGGIEPLNPDLATTAGIDAAALADNSAYPWPFYHRELRFESVRHYADFIGQGRYALSWFGQAIAAGEFAVERSHAEQMYDPDVYGNGVAARLRISARAP